jgi:hypothetical protein
MHSGGAAPGGIMQTIRIAEGLLLEGTKILSQGGGMTKLLSPAAGGGLSLPALKTCAERYVVFRIEMCEAHSAGFNLHVWSDAINPEGSAFRVMFGVMPRVEALICLDLNWLDAHILFPGQSPGQLKVVCHGGRVRKDEIDRVTLESYPSFHDVGYRISDLTLTDEKPEAYPLPDVKLIDELGQYKLKSWPQKISGVGELKEKLQKALSLPDAYCFDNWDEYGGCADMSYGAATGFFAKAKRDGRWYILDPLGNAFFSMGPDCIAARSDCRVDDLEKFLDWLPERDDPAYGGMFSAGRYGRSAEDARKALLFSYEQANLYKALGDGWYDDWKKLIGGNLKQNGFNSLGNWSDSRLYGTIKMPYVTMLPEYPSTETTIFRDFPDVLSDEYKKSASECAEYLKAYSDDPYMIGYFLRNEPPWAFVNNLIIAEEALYNPADTVCKRELIKWLKEKYQTPAALSEAWKRGFGAFEDLKSPIYAASRLSGAAKDDLQAFSRIMLEAYVGIPSEACRAADPNHMNLGMRWAWISDPDIITGWKHFDVFSINNYSVDPTSALDNVAALGVDLPVVIGEFHFGALDSGLTATGLEGVLTQEERGVAYRYYCERVAAHPLGAGCHFFQCYDQFELGRFDGENYNIGLFDICSQPYAEMMDASRKCGATIYAVARGDVPPTDRLPRSIPMIAY